MATVNVLTMREAADRLGTYRARVRLMLETGELTPATINDRPAVLVDTLYRRAERKPRKVAA